MLIFALLHAALATAPTEYTIGAGDTVTVVVHGHEDAFQSTDFYVGGNGNLSLPYVGEVAIAGKSPFEAEAIIREKLANGYILDPHVSVTVKEYKSQQLEVIGDVDKSGVYPIEGPTTIRAMMIEVGVRAGQSSGSVTIRRGDTEHTVAFAQLDGQEGLYLLQGGDVVDVDQGTSVFLFGQVVNPGPVKYVEGLTAAGAFGTAGGPSEYSSLRGAYILRDGEKIQVNLKRVLRGKETDVLLLPGDKLFIPRSTF